MIISETAVSAEDTRHPKSAGQPTLGGRAQSQFLFITQCSANHTLGDLATPSPQTTSTGTRDHRNVHNYCALRGQLSLLTQTPAEGHVSRARRGKEPGALMEAAPQRRSPARHSQYLAHERCTVNIQWVRE